LNSFGLKRGYKRHWQDNCSAPVLARFIVLRRAINVRVWRCAWLRV